MDTPAIADDGLYQVHVMWLDGISLDARVQDPANKRYIENKRSTQVHSKGWESIGAACVDARVSMITDGNYQKIPTSEKAMIVTRQQSWMLLDHDQGKLPNGATPPVLPQQPMKLRPGQSKKKSVPAKTNKAAGKHKQAAPSNHPPRKLAKPVTTMTKPKPTNGQRTHKASESSTNGAYILPLSTHATLAQDRVHAFPLRKVIPHYFHGYSFAYHTTFTVIRLPTTTTESSDEEQPLILKRKTPGRNQSGPPDSFSFPLSFLTSCIRR